MLFFLSLIEDEEDAAFMEGLYQAHYRLMYYQALRVLRNPQDAEDAVSSAVIRLIKKTGVLRTLPSNKQEAYLVITVKHTAINLYNQRKARMERTGGQPLETLEEDRRLGPEARVADLEGVERVKEAIRGLPPREREALMMRYFQRLSDREIAETMGIREVSARALMYRGRKRLQEKLLEGRG